MKTRYIFKYEATLIGIPVKAIVAGWGEDEVSAMADAAERLHKGGYQNVVVMPR